MFPVHLLHPELGRYLQNSLIIAGPIATTPLWILAGYMLIVAECCCKIQAGNEWEKKAKYNKETMVQARVEWASHLHPIPNPLLARCGPLCSSWIFFCPQMAPLRAPNFAVILNMHVHICILDFFLQISTPPKCHQAVSR
jgi:hypothetical protein